MVVRLARKRIEGPLSIHSAMGLGRSYGQESRFLEKKSLGIFLCGIWDALEQEKKIPTTAIVTDIGNDLAYEVPVEQVVEWVEACVDRLLSHDATVVLSDLPLDVLRSTSETRYKVVRTLLFPNCRLSWSEMLQRAQQLSERLRKLAEARNIPLFVGDSAWYGWDPIHPRRADLPKFWNELLDGAGISASKRVSNEKLLWMTWYLRGLRPEKWSSFSFSRSAVQPSGRLIDGTKISLY